MVLNHNNVIKYFLLGTLGLQGLGAPFLLVVAITIGIALFVSGVLILRETRKLTNQVSSYDVRGRSGASNERT